MEATRQLLEERGAAEKVSIAAVCERAMCTPPSIYYYFVTKDHLLREACVPYFNRFFEQLSASRTVCSSPDQELLYVGDVFIRWALEHPAAYRVLFAIAPFWPD